MFSPFFVLEDTLEATLHWVFCDTEKKHGQIDGQLRTELQVTLSCILLEVLEMLPDVLSGQAIIVADTSIGIMIDISRINATWKLTTGQTKCNQ